MNIKCTSNRECYIRECVGYKMLRWRVLPVSASINYTKERNDFIPKASDIKRGMNDIITYANSLRNSVAYDSFF